VRFLGNRSSGKQGYAIAEELARRGAAVTLVSGPTTLPDPFGVLTVRVQTALEMQAAANAAFDACDVVVGTAAVADFRPETVADDKIKKNGAPDALRLVRNPDILAELGSRKGERVLIGFAAESRDVIAYARQKLIEKNLDLVVANDITEPGLGFGSESNRVTFVSAEAELGLETLSKHAIATLLADEISRLVRDRA